MTKYRIPIGSKIVRFSTSYSAGRANARFRIERGEVISTKVAIMSDSDMLTTAEQVRDAGGPFHANTDMKHWRWFRVTDDPKWTVFAVEVKYLEMLY